MTEPMKNDRPALARETVVSAELEAAALTTVLDRISDLSVVPEDIRHAWMEGYERGVTSGYTRGYEDGLDVVRPAAEELARLKPSEAIAAEVARNYRNWRERPRWASPVERREAS